MRGVVVKSIGGILGRTFLHVRDGSGDGLEGLRLCAPLWRVEPLEVIALHTAYFDDEARFPPGSVEFDSALIMRNVPHEWHIAPLPRTMRTP